MANGPPLTTPVPPPREVGPVENLAAAPVTTGAPDTPATDVAPRNPPPQTTSKPAAVRSNPPAKPETAAEQPAAAAPPAGAAAAPAPETPREVRSAPSAAAAAEDRKVRDVLQRARSQLKGVDPDKLSSERKLQYNQSTRFAEQADEALKDRNFPYAMTLADKAKQLADELAALRQ